MESEMIRKRITKKNNIIQKPQFDVEFEYLECNGEGKIIVRRLSGKDILQTINFWGGDRLKTFEQFNDACVCWCDRNAA